MLVSWMVLYMITYYGYETNRVIRNVRERSHE